MVYIFQDNFKIFKIDQFLFLEIVNGILSNFLFTTLNMKKSFIISSAGLRNIVFVSKNGKSIANSFSHNNKKSNFDDDDFCFLIGDKKMQMNRYLADFISPRVSHIHQVDPTINILDINPFVCNVETKEIFTDDLLENFKLISLGYPIEIDEEMSIKLRYLSFYLDNEEMTNQLNKLFPIEFTQENIGSCIQCLQYYDQSINQKILNPAITKEALIDLISKYFYLIEENKLFQLSKPDLYSILSNPNLKVKNEDSLLDFINNISFDDENKNEDVLSINDKMLFYEQIKIECLSKNKLKEFINSIIIDQMSQNLWSSIRNYLFYEISKKNVSIVKIPYDNRYNEKFNGIISHLIDGDVENAIDEGIIDVICSSVYDNADDIQPRNVLNYKNDLLVFQSQGRSDSWVCIDFKNHRVKPSNYSIGSPYNSGPGCGNLQNWCIEGSNNLTSWKLLDTRRNEKSLDDSSATMNFEIQNQNDEYFRYLRIRQIDLNTANDYDLYFSSIEFFGKVFRTIDI